MIRNSNVFENIKEEIKEEENVDDPHAIEGDTNKVESEIIVKEVKEEVIDDDPLSIQGLNCSVDEENSKVIHDIVIETDIQ